MLLEKMNVFEAIVNRKTVKEFDSRDVDDSLIGIMLYMATHTNSAGSLQPWEFIVVKDEDQRKKLAVAALRQNVLAEAPVNIVVCANMERTHLRFDKRGTLYGVQDTAAAVSNMVIAATALDLGVTWVRAFDEDEVKSILGLPDALRPVAILAVGHIAAVAEDEHVTPFEHVTWVDKYGKKFEFAISTKRGREDEHIAKPIGNYLEDELKKLKKKMEHKKGKEKQTFNDILKKLTS